MPPPSIRKARADDTEALIAVLARAFDTDPFMHWLLPPGAARAPALARFYRLALGRLTLPHGEVYTDDAHRGAALWTPPGAWRLRWYEHLRDLPAWGGIIGWTRMPRILPATMALQAWHPHEPHYYLMAIGVDPAHQGHGLGKALMRPILERCDREGVAAYLEASSPKNVPLYRSVGFVVQQEVRMGDDGPPVFPMLRPAGASAASA